MIHPPTHTVILAAGQGTRLRPHTDNQPKCMVPLCGVPLLERLLASLSACGLTQPLTLVGGYRVDVLQQAAPSAVSVIINGAYDTTNMVASLACAKPAVTPGNDLLMCYSDIVVESRVLQALLAYQGDAPVVMTSLSTWQPLWAARMANPLADVETFVMDADQKVLSLGQVPNGLGEVQGQFMGVVRIKAAALPAVWQQVATVLATQGPNAYMTDLLQALIDNGLPVQAIPVAGGWLEVDSCEDLQCYENLAAQGVLGNYCQL